MFRGLLLLCLLATGAAAAPAKPRLIEGLDHMPVAVRDLDRAAADFARLGFVVKPGRAHDNGVRNSHVKFPNGGGIELISASRAADSLSADYVRWLKGGDGPAFWSLYSRDLASLAPRLNDWGLRAQTEDGLVSLTGTPFHRLFFADRLRSPTDGPKYWAHPNTAYRLKAVWLATRPEMRDLLIRLGGERSARGGCAPFDSDAEIIKLPGEDDEAILAHVRRTDDRVIVGATVLVHDLAAARRILQANGVAFSTPSSCGDRSLWVKPSEAHGLWLELRQTPRE